MVSPVAKFVVAIGLDGRIASQGTLEQALASDSKLRSELVKEMKMIEKGAEVVDAPIEKKEEGEKKASGKLIVAEEVALGRVSWPARTYTLFRLYGSTLIHCSENVSHFSGWICILGQLCWRILLGRSHECPSNLLARVRTYHIT
jgi:hypothetical protein